MHRTAPVGARAHKLLAIAALAWFTVGACTPRDDDAQYLVCPTKPPECSPYRIGGVRPDLGDPYIPDEPRCHDIGMYDYQVDLAFCKCEFKMYLAEIENNGQCLVNRRLEKARAIYEKVSEIYSCRLKADGCEILWSPILDDGDGTFPSLPHCVEWPADRMFTDQLEADSCQHDILEFHKRLAAWTRSEADRIAADFRERERSAIDALECYARGDIACP